jgi:hypothetical protein
MRDDLLLPIIVAVLAGPADGQPSAYPLHGQSVASQHRDETACSKWASSQSGYDPAHSPLAAPASPEPVTGRGSHAKGAANGAIGGNAGAGTAAGAAGSEIARWVRNRQAADAQNARVAQQVADPRASYFRARKACLGRRGYIVN